MIIKKIRKADYFKQFGFVGFSLILCGIFGHEPAKIIT
jgi:hypothetical protein